MKTTELELIINHIELLWYVCYEVRWVYHLWSMDVLSRAVAGILK